MIFKKNIPLASFSTFKIGGRAEYFFKTPRPENLIKAVEWAKSRKIPWKVFAGGSNIVFPDGKLKGLLIQFSGGGIYPVRNKPLQAAVAASASGRTKRISNGVKILVDAGVPLAQVIKKLIQTGLSGLETLSGIPGTIGGAVIGNAGAYGHSISEILEKAEIWDPRGARGKGKKRWLKNKDCQFSYRESVFKKKDYILLRVVLRFKKGDKEKLRKISREIIKIREKKYKPGLRCPGSFFKNVLVKKVSKESLALIDWSKIIDPVRSRSPQGGRSRPRPKAGRAASNGVEGKIPAGYLLEEVGAKGMRIGNIAVADFHGNLIMNLGGGKASEVKKMANILKKRVRKKFGILLEEEVRYF